MMKTRMILALAASAALVACSGPSSEPVGSSKQPLEADGGTDAAPAACTHAVCATGQGLLAACDPCATKLCAQDPFCCSGTWDATCVGEVISICKQTCAIDTSDAGVSTCAHPVCAAGAALAAGCDSCATSLCAKDPYCCTTVWDATCVTEVASLCAKKCN